MHFILVKELSKYLKGTNKYHAVFVCLLLVLKTGLKSFFFS